MVNTEVLQRKEPYYIPGYTGYCPQHRFKSGENYSNLSHKLLRDPKINHAKKLILVDRSKDHEVVKPTKDDIEVVNSRSNRMDPIYKHPMLSTYDGFIPNLSDERDKPYEIQATEGIANFEKQYQQKKSSIERLEKTVELQSGTSYPKNIEERLLLKSKFRLPLIAVRPEHIGLPEDYLIDERYERPKDYNVSPYFMENINPQKYFIHGYTGYKPHRTTHYGKSHQVMTNYGLRDFTSNYLKKKRIEWAPVLLSNKKEKLPKNNRIFKKDTALMPSYTGHIPGAKFK
ncbi:PREDICTED: UPF0605 protein CG18335 isoform X2 [Ceratosolen solmsi marchali]|nr:PREDICTED: UPF0605 protein CG18335 isoform X2 [Ceratosolen solmsi marchali]